MGQTISFQEYVFVDGGSTDKSVQLVEEAGYKVHHIPFEMDICSAHRLPEKTVDYAKTARERGIEVLIAGAGMAAHLAGVIASHTILPGSFLDDIGVFFFPG
jgi:5-(carboxyamino)imidazole ribonucleotide mutase